MNSNLDALRQQQQGLLQQLQAIAPLRRGSLSQQFFKSPGRSATRRGPIMCSRDSSAGKSFPSASLGTRPPRSGKTWTTTAVSNPWPKTTSPSATSSPACRTSAQTVKKLQPQEIATAQFQETTAFLNVVRHDLARPGVANLEAVELGLRAALFKDGRALLEAL
ncbi:MAG: hypothetical protein IT579_01255 [Verrucomicrobia subdivision 3 bacterium]|nr:hypothetical protein [Verrucomicrobiota bacterium]MCC6819334.1 hypothetical protein [Limisphaerales bacterium]